MGVMEKFGKKFVEKFGVAHQKGAGRAQYFEDDHNHEDVAECCPKEGSFGRHSEQ